MAKGNHSIGKIHHKHFGVVNRPAPIVISVSSGSSSGSGNGAGVGVSLMMNQ